MNSQFPTTLIPFMWHFIKRYKFSFLLFFLAPMVMALETTIMPYGVKLMIDTIAQSPPGLNKIPEGLLLGAAIYAGAWNIEMIVFRLQEWRQIKIIPLLEADIRLSVVDYLSKQSYSYFLNHLSGNLSAKVADLPAALEQIRMNFCWSIWGTLFLVFAGIAYIATVSLLCAGTLFFVASLYIFVSFYIARRVGQAARVNAEDKSKLSGGVVDTLTNILPVKLFARRGFELGHLRDIQTLEIGSNRKLRLTVWHLRIGMDLVITLMLVGVLWTLVYGWKQGYISSGDVALVIMSMLAMINQLWFMSQNLMEFFKHVGVAKQALAVICVPITVNDIPEAKQLKVTEGRIVFDQVNFQYHQERALFSNKNISIEPGSRVGLVGYSGSGKTTFVHLILRFFDLVSGHILIDGQNIAEVTQDSLHENIVMVPQDTTLFHRSLRENIAYGNPSATEEQIIKAAKDAHCHEFISALPEGYETLVGDRGVKLSGGQRQRIAIARAMLKPAPILILDEATSALDSVTEKFIQESMKTVMKNRTTIVVAHRLSTLAEMDRILVFDQGHVIEDGPHDQLIALGGHYAHLWHMQSEGFLPTQKI
jgi:ATP-binding cassette subfamily B protein